MKIMKFSARGIRLRQGTLVLKALTNPFTPLMNKFSARGMEQREAATAGATVTERRGG